VWGDGVGIVDIDHVALPTARPEQMLTFYRALGFSAPTPEKWRERGLPFFALSLGNTKINVHAPELWKDPSMKLRGPTAQPGCGDFCFVWSGRITALGELLAAVGATVEEGPVERQGGRGGGRTVGTCLYTRDPDGNLLEFITYP
jgi:catechol 2,3-dioxygenase-like lactoylglutathione lyase family enzyme